MQTLRYLWQSIVNTWAAHPRLARFALGALLLVGAVLTGHLHPIALSLLVVGVVQFDDVNTITTKDIMPGVADC